jgi:hypothetical protein
VGSACILFQTLHYNKEKDKTKDIKQQVFAGSYSHNH